MYESKKWAQPVLHPSSYPTLRTLFVIVGMILMVQTLTIMSFTTNFYHTYPIIEMSYLTKITMCQHIKLQDLAARLKFRLQPGMALKTPQIFKHCQSKKIIMSIIDSKFNCRKWMDFFFFFFFLLLGAPYIDHTTKNYVFHKLQCVYQSILDLARQGLPRSSFFFYE